jgi:hypothetical protein
VRPVESHRYRRASSPRSRAIEYSTTLLVSVVCLSFWKRHFARVEPNACKRTQSPIAWKDWRIETHFRCDSTFAGEIRRRGG